MPSPTGLEGVYSATNEALKRMESDARKLSRQVEEATASLLAINAEKEQAMEALQQVKAQKDALHADIANAWEDVVKQKEAVLATLEAKGKALDERERAIAARHEAATEQERKAGEAMGQHLDAKEKTKAQVVALCERITEAANALR